MMYFYDFIYQELCCVIEFWINMGKCFIFYLFFFFEIVREIFGSQYWCILIGGVFFYRGEGVIFYGVQKQVDFVFLLMNDVEEVYGVYNGVFFSVNNC